MAIYNFSWVIQNKLAGSAMPGKSSIQKEYILSDLMDLKAKGINRLLSLNDMAISFSSLCSKANLKWMYYPIPDFGVPTNLDTFRETIDSSLECMNQDESLCVHCYAGIGRTGVVLACIAGKYYSLSGPKAVDLIRSKRTAIETTTQIKFIYDFLDT